MSVPSISQAESVAMRGIAIVGIMLHNLLHWGSLGFVPENESSFLMRNPMLLLEHCANPDSGLIWDLFSFFGWYGVPVFIFLSAYGLVQKYENSGKEFRVKEFLIKNYLKLLLLLIPALLIFAAIDQLTLKCYQTPVLQLLFMCTLLNDFVCLWLPTEPGVYWYLGVALQFYAVYILFYYKRSNKTIIFSIIISLLSLVLSNPMFWGGQSVLFYVKNNCIGYLYIFAIAVWYRRNVSRLTDFKKSGYLLSLIVLSILFIFSSFWFYSWILSTVLFVPIVICVVKLIPQNSGIYKSLLWCGKYSASIFIIHPVLRSIFLTFMKGDVNTYWQVPLYILSVFALSWMYQKYYIWAKTAMLHKI
ncbi:MAG: acyltransferase family protein [Paludibacteraceae bacterium]|nr:acyltransferase family protein [Paludibacteraceae bacterium]